MCYDYIPRFLLVNGRLAWIIHEPAPRLNKKQISNCRDFLARKIMPDILLYSPDPLYLESIQKSGGGVMSDHSIRMKDVQSHDLLSKWVEARKFDGFLVDPAFSLSVVRQAYELIIESNPLALCGAYSKVPLLPERVVQLHDIGLEVIETEQKLLNYLKVFENSSQRALLPILVVEDLSSPREIIEMYLEHMGYPVKSVGSAKVALELLKEDPEGFFCVISDIRMPEMNGVDLIRAIRADQTIEDIPVIVLSAYGTGQLLIDCLDAGASGFLAKPPRREDIVRELGRARQVALGIEPVRLVESSRIEQVKEAFARKGLLT
jgi:CheY-like chemotaxis protein